MLGDGVNDAFSCKFPVVVVRGFVVTMAITIVINRGAVNLSQGI